MATLVISDSPNDYTSVFRPIQINYEWQDNSCLVYNASGALGIRVDIDFSGSVAVGDFVQVLNGSYKGSYKVQSLSDDSTHLFIVTDGAFVSSDALSNKFNIDARQVFELYAGYSSGAGATAKPYQKIADISVAINPTSYKFEIDLQSYLRSYYTINDPEAGKDYGLSLQWQIKPVGGSLTAFKYSYYASEAINSAIVGTQTPLGNVPLTFINENTLGNIPTFFSVIEDSENAVSNILSGVDTITTTSTDVIVSLVSGQKVTLVIIKSSGNWGTMTLDPSVSWATIISTVDDVLTIEIDTNTSVPGDYSSVDYDSVDYLTSGINSLVGEHNFDILEGGSPIGTIDVFVYPTLQIRRICQKNSLNFAFLNRSGGWNSLALECKFIKGFDIGGAQTYLDAGSILRRTEVQDVYANYSINVELMTTFELDLLARMRTSIQAYLYNEDTLAFDIPIIIDASSFETYGNRQRQPERTASFNFRVATKQAVQTQ